MSTDLASLLGKKTFLGKKNKRAEKEEEEDGEEEADVTAPAKQKRKATKTKEEKEADEAQRELFFEEKFKCDYETYTIKRVESRPSRMNPEKQVIAITWLDDKCPPPEILAQMGQATQRLAMASRGGIQGERGWHEERDERSITSSMLARALAMSEPHVSGDQRAAKSQQALLEHAKLKPKFEGNALTEHGTRMEPFARRVYMQERAKQPVIQIGFIPHPTNLLCGASPDGIVLDGSRLVELKCPKQRYFQEGDAAPLGYWHQVRFQLEVCAAATSSSQHPDGMIEHCDYFECRHMKRPRGLRSNCVDIMRDKQWFESIQPVIEQYDIHLKRLRRLRKLFPDHLFNAAAKEETFEVANTMPKLFRAVALQE